MDHSSPLDKRLGNIVLDRGPLAVCIFDRHGRYLFANPVAEDLLGYRANELTSLRIPEMVHPEDSDRVLAAFRQLLECGQTKVGFRMLRRDGACVDVVIEAIGLDEETFCGFYLDVSALKHTEWELRKSEALLRTLVENSAELIVMLDPEGVVTYVSPQCEAILGHPAESLLGKPIPDIFHPEDVSLVQGTMRRVLVDREEVHNLEYRIVDTRGRVRWMSHSAKVVVANRVPVGVHNSLRNVTEYHESLQALAGATRFNETILNTSPDLIYVYDVVERRNVYSNERISEVLGFSVAEIGEFGNSLIANLMHPEDFSIYSTETLSRYAAAGDRELIEHRYRMRHKQGGWRWLNSKELVFRRNPDGSPRQIFGLIADVTDKVEAEEHLEGQRKALADSEEKYRKLFENMLVGFAMHRVVEDDEGRPVDYVFLEANEAFGRMTGLDPKAIIGKRVTSVIPGIENDSGNWISRYGVVAKQGTTFNFEQYSEILERWYAVVAYCPRPDHFVTIIHDVTEQKSLEQRLHQSQKMQAIGQLAGGIAHDFNNQLSAIVGCADLLRLELSGNRDLSLYAEDILVAAQRAADLTRQLLAFARRGKYLSVPVNLHDVIAEVKNLLRHTLDKRIRITERLTAQYPYTMGDPSQLQSALMNLALNARDAMPDGGELILSTAEVDLGEEFCRGNEFDIRAGRYLTVRVTDTGCGMDSAIRKRIFEPFFTTKAPGKGTGMGLAAVYGTVKSHGGALEVASEPGRGTTVELFLPLSRDAGEEVVEPSPSESPRRQNVRVLIVDDDVMLAESIGRMLKKVGYDVVTCTDGRQALAYYESRGAEVGVVILDLIMPDPNGLTVLRRLRAINPHVKVILSSGYSLEDEAQTAIAEGVCAFIQKPFRIKAIAQVLEEVLERPVAVARRSTLGR